MNNCDEDFLNGSAPDVDKQFFRECKLLVQPWIDKMIADPHGDHSKLHEEVIAKIQALADKRNGKQ